MDSQAKRQVIEAASLRGDHAEARRLSSQLLEDPEASADDRLRAQRVLRETGTDPFIFVAGALGLGLLLWLVYKYSQ